MRVISGFQSTGSLHLGNYLGALRNWLGFQDKGECLFFLADMHAITLVQDPQALKRNTLFGAAAILAIGIDPEKSIIFPQSAVPAHTYLQWIFSCLTPMGWLNRMTQFKEKAGKHRETVGLGLYSYPVLMAADILVYKATHVPVGEDQKQHLELTRDIAGFFNRTYGVEYFPLTEPMIMGAATRVMSLRDGTKKMSKSDSSDYSRIHLTDTADEIRLKIQKAKTDPDLLPRNIQDLDTRPEAKNLLTMYASLQGQSLEESVVEFEGAPFSRLKTALCDAVVARIEPIGFRIKDLMNDEPYLRKILAQGADRANRLADIHVKEIKEIVGFF